MVFTVEYRIGLAQPAIPNVYQATNLNQARSRQLSVAIIKGGRVVKGGGLL